MSAINEGALQQRNLGLEPKPHRIFRPRPPLRPAIAACSPARSLRKTPNLAASARRKPVSHSPSR